MLQINASNIKPKNTARRGIEYMPVVKLKDNKRVGENYAFDGTTQAKGTLYPANFNNSSGIGSIQTYIDTEFNGETTYPVDNGFFANNEVKHKTAPNFFQSYRKLNNISMAFIQQEYSFLANNFFGGSGAFIVRKSIQLSATTFMVFYKQNSPVGTYAVVVSVAPTTGFLNFGTPVSLSTTTALLDAIDASVIATNKVVVVFPQTATTMRNVILTVSGSTITAGTPVDHTIASGTHSSLRTEKVDNDKYMTVWYNSGVSYGQAYVTTVSGTTPTNGTVSNLFGNAQIYSYQLALGSTTGGAIAAQSSSNNAFVQAFTISGTTLTLGTGTQISPAWNTDGSVATHGAFFATSSTRYYLSNFYSSPHDYYLVISGTNVSVLETRHANYGNQPMQGAYTNNPCTRVTQLSTTEWTQLTYDTSNVDWVIYYKYDPTQDRVSITRRKYASSTKFFNSYKATMIVPCGSNFVTLSTTDTDGNNIYYAVHQAGSCEVYFEAEGTASATLTNPVLGWAYSPLNVNKVVPKTTAFLSLKNVTGNQVKIDTTDWVFEVE